MSVTDKLASRSANNFDFLRLLAAMLVIFTHSYTLSGFGANEPLSVMTGNRLTMAMLGVIIFFVISGYLITKSWYNHPDIIRFFWNRFLRIVPGLFVLSIFTILVAGPLVTSCGLLEYFSNPATWSYLKISTIVGSFDIHNTLLPGVFDHNPYPHVVNGSIWTLPIEFVMYVFVFVIGALGLVYKRKYVFAMAMIASLLNILLSPDIYAFTSSLAGQIAPSAIMGSLLEHLSADFMLLFYPSFFIIGAAYYVSGNGKLNKYVAATALIVWLLSFNTMLFYATSVVCLPYLILFVAQAKVPCLNNTGKYGDFSYGVYIYAFLVQQIILNYAPETPVIQLFILSVLMTFPLAYLSWTLVESKALRLKSADPVKEIRHYLYTLSFQR